MVVAVQAMHLLFGITPFFGLFLLGQQNIESSSCCEKNVGETNGGAFVKGFVPRKTTAMTARRVRSIATTTLQRPSLKVAPPFSSSLLFAVAESAVEEDAASTRSSTTSPVDYYKNNKYERLLEWLSTQHNAFINDKIIVQPSASGNGYGAFVTETVAADELLFTVPRSACVTLDRALNNNNNVGTALQQLVEKAGPGGNTVALAGFLAKEWLTRRSEPPAQEGESDEPTRLSLAATPYGPYLDTLPWERGVNNQEHILFWSDEEIESKLKGSQCYREALDLRNEVNLAIRVLDRIIGKPANTNAGAGTFLFPWQKPENQQQQPQQPTEGLPEAVKGAFVCLLTRAFQDGDGDEEKLVPLLDMLQHSDEPNVSHVMCKDGGMVEVRARRALRAGDELMNQYRSEMEENMPYHRFFTRFGFVPGIQEPIENLLADRSSIFFPQKAEV